MLRFILIGCFLVCFIAVYCCGFPVHLFGGSPLLPDKGEIPHDDDSEYLKDAKEKGPGPSDSSGHDIVPLHQKIKIKKFGSNSNSSLGSIKKISKGNK